MSLTKSRAWLAALLALATFAPLASGEYQPSSPGDPSATAGKPGRFVPFLEPDYFGPDLQFFAPADVTAYGDGWKPRTGFFGSFTRLYINVKRPDGIASFNSGFNGDWTWGNLIDGGYMTDDNVGWHASVWDIRGPNQDLVTYQDRINRDPANPNNNNQGGGGGGGTGGNTSTIPNLPQDRIGQYKLTSSINHATFTSFELNRVWRRKQFHNGAVLEPLIGARVMVFRQFGAADSYARFEVDPISMFPDFTTPSADGPYEILTQNRTTYQNNLYGGQLGFRLTKQVGHWNLSSDVKVFGCENWQFLTTQNVKTQTLYDSEAMGSGGGGGGGGTTGPTVVTQRIDQTIAHSNKATFVWGGEIRVNGNYQLTRDIFLGAGFVFLDLGQGIGRGSSTEVRSSSFQGVQLTGMNFGVTFNR